MSKRWAAVALVLCSVFAAVVDASARGIGSPGTMGSRGMTAGSAVTSISASPGDPLSEYSHTCFVSDGTVHCWGGNLYGQLGDGTEIDRAAPVQVVGLVACWGINDAGQLGDGTTSDRLSPVEGPSFRAATMIEQPCPSKFPR